MCELCVWSTTVIVCCGINMVLGNANTSVLHIDQHDIMYYTGTDYTSYILYSLLENNITPRWEVDGWVGGWVVQGRQTVIIFRRERSRIHAHPHSLSLTHTHTPSLTYTTGKSIYFIYILLLLLFPSRVVGQTLSSR